VPWPEKAITATSSGCNLPQLIEGRTDCADGCLRIRQQRANAAESAHKKGVKRGGIATRAAKRVDLR